MEDEEQGRIVRHEIITSAAGVPKFSGDANTIEINQFLLRMDTLIANKKLTSERLKIEVLKQHVDAENGRARHVICYRQLEELDDYDAYVQVFRRHFSKKSDQDPLRAMVKMLALKRPASQLVTEYVAKLDLWGKDMEKLLRASEWTLPLDGDHMSVTLVSKLIMFSKILSDCDDVTSERLYKDLKETQSLGEIDCMLRGYAETNPRHDSYVMPIRSTHTPPPQASNSGTRYSRSLSRSGGPTENRPRSVSWQRPPQVECYQCGRPGHVAMDCCNSTSCGNCQYTGHTERNCYQEPWCSYHKYIGHRTRDCRARRANNLRAQNFRTGPPS
ncbi:hypothetical protein GWK47_011849 [Chionoecetes opilio]|uniref:CCHC-type domain-containing protein n=1 Tax=Chionoecetes opilio TaxID=41210 RepID=A0A8J5CM46_CHIOP|nr:hypothetical protein GWK47_011849 [Chionoecetes opilio]